VEISADRPGCHPGRSILAVKLFANRRNIANPGILTCKVDQCVWAIKAGYRQANLINNAIKFSPEGKTVDVMYTSPWKKAHVAIAGPRDGNPAEIYPTFAKDSSGGRNVTIAEIPGSGMDYILSSR